MNILNHFLGLFICLLLSPFILLAQDQLPSIELSNIKGEKVKVSDYSAEGKITVMSFWATWCGPCKKELNNLSPLYEEWKEKYNMQLVAVSTDDARSSARVRPYAEGQAWDFDVLLDVNEELKRSLNFQAVPYTVVFNQKGELVYRHDGYKEGDEYELEEKLKEISAVSQPVKD